MKDDKNTGFPPEMPCDDKKETGDSVIENVVKKEIHPTTAANAVKYPETDELNTEFARKRIDNDLKQ